MTFYIPKDEAGVPASTEVPVGCLRYELAGGKISNNSECDLRLLNDDDVSPVDSWWLETDGTPIRRTHADFLARQNLSQDQIDTWEKIYGNCHVTELLIYEQGTIAGMTAGQIEQGIRYAGDPDCGYGHLTPYLLEDGTPYLLEDGTPYLIVEEH